MSKLTLDLSMVSDETLRVIEEALLSEMSMLHKNGKDYVHDQVAHELLKLEKHFDKSLDF